MRDWRKWLGVALGLALAVLVLAGASGPAGTGAGAEPVTGAAYADSGGTLRELVIHYVPEAAGIAETAYRDLLGQLPPDVKVYAVCPDAAAFADLQARVGPARCALTPIIVGHPITGWSRDRWVALAPGDAGDRVTLWLPRGEDAAAAWPQREGDQRVGEDLAAALPERVRAWRSPLYFDGGDFVVGTNAVFVAPRVLPRNLQRTVQTREAFVKELARCLKLRVVLLHDVPEHHVGMYLMAADEHTVVVGDPGLAQRILARSGAPAAPFCPCGDDFSAETQRLFDNAAEQCAAADYRVVRIPVVPGVDARTYITYVNVLLDRRDGRRTVYLPVYRNAGPLNDAAAEVWRQVGCEVRRVDCTAAYTRFGTLHCLVNVLRRE